MLAAPVGAQVDRATLTGTVTDASGAVVVGAKVTVTHDGSGLAREGKVGTSGAYVIPQLPIGMYTVRIEAAGFRGIQFDKVQLHGGPDAHPGRQTRDCGHRHRRSRCATR